MATVNHVLAVAIWIAACVALAAQSEPVYGFFFFVPFSLWPHAVTHGLCFQLKSRGAGILLACGMIAYSGWFFFVYANAFYFNPDAQSAISLLFVGIAALPVMVPVWLGAFVLERVVKRRAEKSIGGGVTPAG